VSAAVWEKLDREPGFRERMERAKRDMEAGRWFHRDENGEWVPNPDWPKDGPQPREKHDAEQAVIAAAEAWWDWITHHGSYTNREGWSDTARVLLEAVDALRAAREGQVK
jgi:hypothetical protein